MSNSDRNTQLSNSNEPLGSATPLQHTRLLSQIKGDQHERMVHGTSLPHDDHHRLHHGAAEFLLEAHAEDELT